MTPWMVSAHLALATPAQAQASIETQALAQAQADLRGNIAQVGPRRYLLAGKHQFHALWVRDFAMAAAGALDSGETQAVHDSLEKILENQRADGLLPRLIDHIDAPLRVLLSGIGLRPKFAEPLRAFYGSENGVVSIDSNAGIPIAAQEYLARTHDRAFAAKWWPAATRAVAFLETRYGDPSGLIARQPPFSDWEDSIARRGRVAFTNELHVLALRALAAWALELGQIADAVEYGERAARAAERFREFFWDPADHKIFNFERDPRWSADANFLAVARGLVSPEQGREILTAANSTPLADLGRVTWPDYSHRQKSFFVRLAGLADYHDRLRWIWLGALAAQAARATGDSARCLDRIHELSALILRTGHVAEVYRERRSTLKPVRRLLYRSEMPFTWSSGYFIHAATQGCGP